MARLTRKAFAAWLAQQDGAPEYACRDPHGCPLARFLGKGSAVHPGNYYVGFTGLQREMPRWASLYVEAIDSQPGPYVGHSTAARILRELPR